MKQGRRAVAGEVLLFYVECSGESSLVRMVLEERADGGGKQATPIFGERAFEVEVTS